MTRLRRLLCRVFGHRWQARWVTIQFDSMHPEMPAQEARRCRRCHQVEWMVVLPDHPNCRCLVTAYNVKDGE